MRVLQFSPTPLQALLNPLSGQEMLLMAESHGPSMRANTPSLRDRIGNSVYDLASNLGFGSTANRMRNEAQFAADFVPGVGDFVALDDAGRAYQAGDYGQAALDGVSGLIGAFPVAGDLAGGAAKAIFGGIMAKTADKGALSVAEKMFDEGYDRDSIWQATGWFKGPDGKWRFEIDDSGAKLNHTQVAIGGASPNKTNRLSQVISHDPLYEAYPDMADISATMRMDAGEMDGTYSLPRYVGSRRIEGIEANAAGRNDLRSVGLHEMQHAVQQREGFAGGSSLMGHKQEDVWEAAKQAYLDSDQDAALLRDLGIDVKDVAIKPWDELTDRERVKWLERGRERLYVRSAGEAEARNVQDRMDMTPAQRRQRAPWETEDVPFSQQIVR
jgi:hypothetical protein